MINTYYQKLFVIFYLSVTYEMSYYLFCSEFLRFVLSWYSSDVSRYATGNRE